jgi:transposase
MRVATLFNRLLSGKGFWVRSVRLEAGEIHVSVVSRRRVPRCGGCGRIARRVHDRKRRVWRHLAILAVRIFLEATVRRVHCRRCGVRSEQVAWARTGSLFTRDFEDQVAGLTRATDKTTVKRLFGISWVTVGRIAGRVVREKLDPERFKTLAFIGIDEFSYQRRHKYATIVMNHESGEPVWVRQGRSIATLEQFFDQIGPEGCLRLELVTLDMSNAYIEAVKRRCPNAKIIFDRFHVERLLHDALDQVRRQEVAQLPHAERPALKNTRFLLLKAPWNLDRGERQRLSHLEKANRRLFRAYLLKEDFLAAYSYAHPAWARARFLRWIRWGKRSRLQPFRRVASTVQLHLDGILNFFRYRLTNGPLEGMNNKIRLLSHRAYGFKSAHTLAAMIFLCCSKFPLPLPAIA